MKNGVKNGVKNSVKNGVKNSVKNGVKNSVKNSVEKRLGDFRASGEPQTQLWAPSFVVAPRLVGSHHEVTRSSRTLR